MTLPVSFNVPDVLVLTRAGFFTSPRPGKPRDGSVTVYLFFAARYPCLDRLVVALQDTLSEQKGKTSFAFVGRWVSTDARVEIAFR